MPIIDQPALPAASVRVNRQFRRLALDSIRQMESVYENALENVFKHPSGLSAQQVCDALGTDCKELFQLFAAMKTLVETHTGKTLTPVSTYGNITMNGDGTVTVNSVV